MARLLADEHFSYFLLNWLRMRHGHDVLTARNLCRAASGDGLSDRQVMEAAQSDRRTVLTKNVPDFLVLHRSMPSHSGIIACSFPDPDRNDKIAQRRIARKIDEVIKEHKGILDNEWIRLNAEDFLPGKLDKRRKRRRS